MFAPPEKSPREDAAILDDLDEVLDELGLGKEDAPVIPSAPRIDDETAILTPRTSKPSLRSSRRPSRGQSVPATGSAQSEHNSQGHTRREPEATEPGPRQETDSTISESLGGPRGRRG